MLPSFLYKTALDILNFSLKSIKMSSLFSYGLFAIAYAILFPFNSMSSIKMSIVFCPRFKPPSRADSTRTSNHDSIDFVKKFTDTKYTIDTGIRTINPNEMTNRNVNLLPVISFLTLCSNLNTWKIIRRNRHTTKAIEMTSKTIKVSFDTKSVLDNDCASRIKNPNPITATEVIRYFIIYSYQKLSCLTLHPTTY